MPKRFLIQAELECNKKILDGSCKTPFICRSLQFQIEAHRCSGHQYRLLLILYCRIVRKTMLTGHHSLRHYTNIKHLVICLLQNLQPNHRANDVVTLEDSAHVISAKFMYGSLDITSLTGEKVSGSSSTTFSSRDFKFVCFLV